MPFGKETLINAQYTWEDTAPSVFTGSPSRRPFNRFNGNQVLFLINLYGLYSQSFSLEEARRVEKLLLYHLPMETKSEISVFTWLKTAMQSSLEEYSKS